MFELRTSKACFCSFFSSLFLNRPEDKVLKELVLLFQQETIFFYVSFSQQIEILQSWQHLFSVRVSSLSNLSHHFFDSDRENNKKKDTLVHANKMTEY